MTAPAATPPTGEPQPSLSDLQKRAEAIGWKVRRGGRANLPFVIEDALGGTCYRDLAEVAQKIARGEKTGGAVTVMTVGGTKTVGGVKQQRLATPAEPHGSNTPDSLPALGERIRTAERDYQVSERHYKHARVALGMLWLEARTRFVDVMGPSRSSWKTWVEEYGDGRSTRDVRRLIKIATAPDPEAEAADQRLVARESMKKSRASQAERGAIDGAKPLWDNAPAMPAPAAPDEPFGLTGESPSERKAATMLAGVLNDIAHASHRIDLASAVRGLSPDGLVRALENVMLAEPWISDVNRAFGAREVAKITITPVEPPMPDAERDRLIYSLLMSLSHKLGHEAAMFGKPDSVDVVRRIMATLEVTIADLTAVETPVAATAEPVADIKVWSEGPGQVVEGFDFTTVTVGALPDPATLDDNDRVCWKLALGWALLSEEVRSSGAAYEQYEAWADRMYAEAEKRNPEVSVEAVYHMGGWPERKLQSATAGQTENRLFTLWQTLKPNTQKRCVSWIEDNCPAPYALLDETHTVREAAAPFRAMAKECTEAELDQFIAMTKAGN